MFSCYQTKHAQGHTDTFKVPSDKARFTCQFKDSRGQTDRQDKETERERERGRERERLTDRETDRETDGGGEEEGGERSSSLLLY